MDSLTQVFMFVLLIGGAVSIRWYMDTLDRDRIRENVAEHGGEVLDITLQIFRWGWPGMSSARLYEVTYRTRSGHSVTADCATTMFSGVQWLRQSPPGSHATELPEDLDTPAEPITCLSCGAKIPSSSARCPDCGWSYRAQTPSETRQN